MLNTYLRWTALVSVFSVVVVPFIVSNGLFFPFITGKAFFFRVMIEIGFAAWLLLAMRDSAYRPRKSLLLWALVAFLAVIGLADILGENPWKSFWSNFERMEGYVVLIHLFMYFLVASCVLSAEKLWKRFFEWSVWASLLVSLYGVLQLSGTLVINQGGVRVDATFGNATYLAIYLVFNIFFALILASRENPVWKKVSFSAIALLNLVVLYYTATRGAMLGFIGGLFLSALLIALFSRENRRARIVAGSAVGLVVLVVLGFIGIKDSRFVAESPVLSRFASISLSESKTQARAYIWPMAIEGFKERPILGWGQENFNYVFNERYDPRMYAQEQWFDHTHNIVLDWLVAGGALGLLSYLSIIAAALYLLWRKAVDMPFSEKALLTGLGGAYFVHNLFVFDNLVSYILFFSILAYVHYRSTRLEKPVADEAEELDDSDMRVAGPALLVGLVLCLYFFNYRGYATNTAIIDGLRALAAIGQVEGRDGKALYARQAVDSFERALSYNTLGRPEVVERLVESVRSVNAAEVPIETRQRFYDLASKAVEEQTESFKGDARYELFAGGFYMMYNDVDKALLHLEEAARLSPNKQTILFQLGAAYVAKKEYEKAATVFKHAYDIEPSHPDALRYYAASLVYLGRESEARSLLGPAQAGVADEAFLTTYADMGRWDKVIPILRAKIAAEPNVREHRMNLVAAYYQSGNRASAIATLRDMIARDPSFKAEGEEYIRQIQSAQ